MDISKVEVRVVMKLRDWMKSLQIAAIYMGTIVGAGFATGQEILQFFTRFGNWGTYAIIAATFFFIWLGNKVMLLAHQIQAKSYEDLNIALFGKKLGSLISLFMLVVLLGVSAVMLAGAGTVFEENWNLPYQLGLIATCVICFLLLRRGMHAIIAVNSIVVPIMLLFTLIMFFHTLKMPNTMSFMTIKTDFPLWTALSTPFLYTAFNLALAQAVLVPIGAQTTNPAVIKYGSLLGGLGIGFMLGVGHIALSAHMPGIQQFSIPMGGIALNMSSIVYYIYIAIIFSEVFTTLLADIYGLALQVHERSKLSTNLIIFFALICCYFLSQLGFGKLLATLYPLFGFISLGWFILIAKKRLSPLKKP